MDYHPPTKCNTVGVVSFIFGLLGGTGSTIVIKLLYQLQAPDSSGEMSYFEKPLFLTWVMFMAMFLALPIFGIMQLTKPPEKRQAVSARVCWMLFVPSLFDLLGTNFAQIGLVFTTVSYFQLLRCTVMIVTAFLKAFVLGDRLAGYMWCGVLVNTIAMVMVGATSFLQPEDTQPNSSASNPVLGIVFILLSCVVQGSQYVFEEKVMAVDDAPPLVVIGMEGLWGTIIMMLVFPAAFYLPGRDKGSLENVLDSFEMVANSQTIQVVLFVFFVTITAYNICCIYVTAYLSAIWHAILDNFRPVSVWATDLLIFYVFTSGAFGESWTVYSWLQAGGMAVLFLGTAIYNGSVRVPCMRYADVYQPIGAMTPVAMRTSQNMASPSLMNSPLLLRSAQSMQTPEGVLPAAVARAKAEGRIKPPARGRAGSHEGERTRINVEYEYDGAVR